MLWGVPRENQLDSEDQHYAGAIKNMEIKHFPTSSTPEERVPVHEDSNNNVLHTIKEIDHFAHNHQDGRSLHAPDIRPLRTIKSRDHLGNDDDSDMPLSRGRGMLQPIKTRVIISKDELDQKLAELKDNQNRLRVEEDNLNQKVDNMAQEHEKQQEFFRDLILQLLTRKETVLKH